MFVKVVERLNASEDRCFDELLTYLQRHIDVDGGEHGPLAGQILEELCGQDETKWSEATASALQALEARKILWDGALKAIQNRAAAPSPAH